MASGILITNTSVGGVMFLDWKKKAFDTMDHAILLLGKLKLYGVHCLSLTGSSKTLDEFKRIISKADLAKHILPNNCINCSLCYS